MRTFILCLVSILLSGCASASSKNKQMAPSSLLEPQATVKFLDIPVPIGFKFLPKDSYSFESSGVRVGVLKYQGKAENPELVINFYKEQMPMYSWVLLNVIEYGDRLMNFERENESCIISLVPKGSNISITISLGPKSQVPSKKSYKPIK
jgi:hypothetical protein